MKFEIQHHESTATTVSITAGAVELAIADYDVTTNSSSSRLWKLRLCNTPRPPPVPAVPYEYFGASNYPMAYTQRKQALLKMAGKTIYSAEVYLVHVATSAIWYRDEKCRFVLKAMNMKVDGGVARPSCFHGQRPLYMFSHVPHIHSLSTTHSLF